MKILRVLQKTVSVVHELVFRSVMHPIQQSPSQWERWRNALLLESALWRETVGHIVVEHRPAPIPVYSTPIGFVPGDVVMYDGTSWVRLQPDHVPQDAALEDLAALENLTPLTDIGLPKVAPEEVVADSPYTPREFYPEGIPPAPEDSCSTSLDELGEVDDDEDEEGLVAPSPPVPDPPVPVKRGPGRPRTRFPVAPSQLRTVGRPSNAMIESEIRHNMATMSPDAWAMYVNGLSATRRAIAERLAAVEGADA